MMSGFCFSRASTQSPSPAEANGRLPPIGRGAGLPVSFMRRVHRIAVEMLTLKRSAAARQLRPDATAATTRSRKSREYGAPIHASLHYPSQQLEPDLTPRRKITCESTLTYDALGEIEFNVPPGLDVHPISDTYATHKTALIRDWLAKRPRWHVHLTPTRSSWLNQVERFFALLTKR